jgi:hypothetical protein
MRNLLHQSKLLEFRNWLKLRDWQIQPTKGEYEVLRAVHANYKHPLIIYQQIHAKEHLTTFGLTNRLVCEFNADRRGIKEACGAAGLPALHTGQKPQGVV